MRERRYSKYVVPFIASALLLLAIFGVIWVERLGWFDLHSLYYGHMGIFRRLPDYISSPIRDLAEKQYTMRWRSYEKIDIVKQFRSYYPNGHHTVSSSIASRPHIDASIDCWAIVYKRYLLTMKVPFTINLFQTGVSSHGDPVFELVELKSITNMGRVNSWESDSPATIFKRDGRWTIFKMDIIGGKRKFGKIAWDKLLKANGDLHAVFPEVVKNKPLKIISDYTEMEKEAAKGKVESMSFLANAYLRGIGVPKDYTKAMKFYRQLAANKRYHSAHVAELYIGFMYYYGKGVKRDFKEARKWYLKAGRYKIPGACYMLGNIYTHGKGCEKDVKEGERWYKIDAEQHNPYAQNALAYMWAEKGKRLPEARKMIDAALLKRPDNPNFIDTSGWIYYKAGDYEKAVKDLKRSTELLANTAVVLDHLGDAYSKLGKKPEAERSWRRALKLTTKKQAELKEKIQKKLNTASQQI